MKLIPSVEFRVDPAGWGAGVMFQHNNERGWTGSFNALTLTLLCFHLYFEWSIKVKGDSPT